MALHRTRFGKKVSLAPFLTKKGSQACLGALFPWRSAFPGKISDFLLKLLRVLGFSEKTGVKAFFGIFAENGEKVENHRFSVDFAKSPKLGRFWPGGD